MTHSLSLQIKQLASELGFADCGISHTDLSAYEQDYFNWIEQGYHGEMHYLEQHGTKRTRPTELIEGTRSIISLRMNYFNHDAEHAIKQLHFNDKAYVSRYALGRDYHKVIRQRLKQLVSFIQQQQPGAQCRIFVDSAPVLERPIAEQAGLGFIGKNSLLIHPRAGSWFFLAEIYTDLALNPDSAFEKQGCGPCRACINECPTQAILDNNTLDARRCISYLTIEHKGSIPLEFRAALGNRIYGCDDCQLVCPWNHFTAQQQEVDFQPRLDLDKVGLLELFAWSEKDFDQKLQGSPIRRIGYPSWMRNLAVALGNADSSPQIQAALAQKLGEVSDLVDEHILWALEQQKQPRPSVAPSYRPKHNRKYYGVSQIPIQINQ